MEEENGETSTSFESTLIQRKEYPTSPLSPLRPCAGCIKLFELAREQKWDEIQGACSYMRDSRTTSQGCFPVPFFQDCKQMLKEKDTLNALYESLQHDPPYEVIKSLLKISPNAVSFQKNATRSTPLHVACYAGASTSIISLLIKSSPGSILQMNRIGWTPLHLLCWGNGADNCTTHLSPHKQLQIAKLLLKPPVDSKMSYRATRAAQMQDRIGWTPLHLVCWGSGSISLVSYLLEHNPKAATLKTKDDWTPLHLCCRYNSSFQVIQALLKAYPKAASVKARGGWTPLHLACWWGSSAPVIRLLLTSDVSVVQMPGWEGRTPLEILIRRSLNHASLQYSVPPTLGETITDEFWDKVCVLLHSAHTGTILNTSTKTSLTPTILAASAMMNKTVICPIAVRAMTFFRISIMTEDAVRREGNLLSMAIQKGVSWYGGLELIFRRCPENIHTRCKKTGLYPFMLAATSGSLETIFELIRTDPELLREF